MSVASSSSEKRSACSAENVAAEVSRQVWMRPAGAAWAARKRAATKSGCAIGSPPVTVIPPRR